MLGPLLPSTIKAIYFCEIRAFLWGERETPHFPQIALARGGYGCLLEKIGADKGRGSCAILNSLSDLGSN